jgi:hypothetical protein
MLDMYKVIPAPAIAGLGLFADVPCTGIDIAGIEPGVSAGHSRSVDTGGWLACAATAELPPDTSRYSIELGDVSIEMASRIL